MNDFSQQKSKFEKELNELDQMTLDAAQIVREGLEKADEEDYIHFLDTMYHYTRYSADHLELAASLSQNEELKEYFKHMVKEEAGHYIVAKVDLKDGYGLEPTDATPQVVLIINQMWQDLKTSKTANGYLGMLYVFENVAKHLGKDVIAFIERLQLEKLQRRWISVHAEADLEHGEEAEEMVLKYMEDDPELLMDSARKAAALWMDLMAYAFVSPNKQLKKAS